MRPAASGSVEVLACGNQQIFCEIYKVQVEAGTQRVRDTRRIEKKGPTSEGQIEGCPGIKLAHSA